MVCSAAARMSLSAVCFSFWMCWTCSGSVLVLSGAENARVDCLRHMQRDTPAVVATSLDRQVSDGGEDVRVLDDDEDVGGPGRPQPGRVVRRQAAPPTRRVRPERLGQGAQEASFSSGLYTKIAAARPRVQAGSGECGGLGGSWPQIRPADTHLRGGTQLGFLAID